MLFLQEAGLQPLQLLTFFLGAHFTWLKALCIGFIIIGVVGIQWTTPSTTEGEGV